MQDIDVGTSAKIKIVEKDADGQDDVATLTATVSGGRIECAWKVVYMEDDDDADSEQEKAEKGYTLPEYAFTVECGGVMSEESGQLDVRGIAKIYLADKRTKERLGNRMIHILKNKEEIFVGKTDSDGFVVLKNLEIGYFDIKVD